MPIEHRDKHTFCPAKISCARIGRRDLASNQLQNELAIGSLYNVRPNISYGQQPKIVFERSSTAKYCLAPFSSIQTRPSHMNLGIRLTIYAYI